MVSSMLATAVLVVVISLPIYYWLYNINFFKADINKQEFKAPENPEKKINEATVTKDFTRRPQKIGSVNVVPGGVSETEIVVANNK